MEFSRHSTSPTPLNLAALRACALCLALFGAVPLALAQAARAPAATPATAASPAAAPSSAAMPSLAASAEAASIGASQPAGLPARVEAPAAAGASVEQMKREIDALQGLLEGRLAQNMPLPALFEIDLGDKQAVDQRIETLQARTTAQAAPAGDEALALRTTRDTLRLAFLRLPQERRDALREQDRLQRVGEALAAEKARSAASLAAAEGARDTALAAAIAARDNAGRELATEAARLLAHLSELSALRQTWVERKQAQLHKYSALLQRYGSADGRPPLSAAEADARYGELRLVLRQLREEGAEALDALDAPTAVKPFGPGLALDGDAFASHAAAVDRVRGLRAKVLTEATSLALREGEFRYADAAEVMNSLKSLQAHWLALLPLLSEQRLAAATGLNAQGLERVLSEVEYVRLMARWYPIQRVHDAQDFASLLRDAFTAGRFGASVFGLLLVLAALVLAYRRAQPSLIRLHRWLLPRIGASSLRRIVDGALQMLIRVARELILLFAVYLLFDQLLTGRAGLPELDTLGRLAYAYAGYRLALTFTHRVLLQAVSRYQIVGDALNAKILSSLKLAARVALLVAVYLILAQALLGRGALYGIAREVALVAAVAVGWFLIRAWRAEVAGAYLAISPEGRLAERVRASQNRSHGLLIAAAAFVFVAARGVWIWLRDSALRFEQTRKALAYLFRRQLERQSKNQPPGPESAALPPELLAALTEDPAPQELRIDVYPELGATLALARGLARGGPGALVALAGERGAGKTTWMLELQRQLGDEVPCTLHLFEARSPAVDSVCLALSGALGLGAETSPQALIESLRRQPPRVVLLDLVQNVLLRTVGGHAGHQALLAIAQATVGHVLWVLAYAHWPFQYVQRMQLGIDVYDRVVTLEPWSEDQIGALIDARMDRAGFVADYDKLVLNDALLRGAPAARLGRVEVDERNADRYQRLVWDYADGNPRVALHFFRLSLVWKSGRTVDVRLFPMPSVDELERFEPRTWFVLACVVQHENLTVDEAAASLRFARPECARALHLLHGHGFLTRNPAGCYRVGSHWARAVQRFLQRKKLLVV